MSLATLRAMNFSQLTADEAAQSTGEGLNKAQCTQIYVEAQAAILGYSCGMSYQSLMAIYNANCK
ncbi:hypothetical protein ABZ832_12920 [Streptantibioticus parmotrematis]|uniref:hypothetical protein n=1 Tax=Streptantibioticus parmotrematis TaxID=2873249 RepID=UPI00340CC5D4